MGNTGFWLLWGSASLLIGTFLFASMVYGGLGRQFLIIGSSSHGHHQIELACDTCHTSAFGGGEVLQKACIGCHEKELKEANDSHPIKKFRDPRNADRLEKINAKLCVTCHREHNPKITRAMGVTKPQDVCAHCHEEIYKNRPTHAGYGFETCANSGCHNYHDNRAIYEDFLEKHQDKPDHKSEQYVALIKYAEDTKAENFSLSGKKPLTKTEADAPADKLKDVALISAWHRDAHAQKGINCKDCHVAKSKIWNDKPGLETCSTCHANEVQTFQQGKHGMRLQKGMFSSKSGVMGFYKEQVLSPMKPELARLPMKKSAHSTALTCNTCHSAHTYNKQEAAVEKCLTCHDDQHSKAYKKSPHYALWEKEKSGQAKPGTGVSCATCHMPIKESENDYGESSYFVTHNQNDTLRPNEKMIRPVCMNCHGLQFSLNSLADRKLINKNFAGSPETHVESIDFVKKRAELRASSSRARSQ